jgi:hypothetical protein
MTAAASTARSPKLISKNNSVSYQPHLQPLPHSTTNDIFMMLRPHYIASFLFLLIFFLTESCMKKSEKQPTPPAPPARVTVTISTKNELLPYLDSLERRYEKACLTMGIANWNCYSKEAPYDLDKAKQEFSKIFLDSVTRDIIAEWRRKAPSLADKVLARRLELWNRCFIGGSIYADSAIATRENTLQKAMTNFAFTAKGKPTTRAEVSNKLRQEKNAAARHKLWSVPSQLSAAMLDDLRALVQLRN